MNLKDLLDAYCDSFNRREAGATLALFCERSLFEFPLLGQRLVGRAEIGAGLARIFEVTASAALSIEGHEESPRMIIAEGRLEAKLYRDPAAVSIPLAVALEAAEGRVSRLSIYLDARAHRLWSDGLLCPPTGDVARGCTP